MTGKKIENLIIFIGFPALWLAIGVVSLIKLYFFIGGIFTAGSMAMAILLTLRRKQVRLNFSKHLTIKDRLVFVVLTIGSVGLGIGGPYLLALFER